MPEVYNPVEIEQAIREVSNRIAKGVEVCNERYVKVLETGHAYDVAFAQAYLDHDGPAHEKKYRAELDTQVQRHQRDVADAAYRHADRRAKALENELRALQSVGASIRAMFGTAGTGVGV